MMKSALIDCEQSLAGAGYKHSERDPNVKPGSPGNFMLTGPNGYAIVGNDRTKLIFQTYDYVFPEAAKANGWT